MPVPSIPVGPSHPHSSRPRRHGWGTGGAPAISPMPAGLAGGPSFRPWAGAGQDRSLRPVGGPALLGPPAKIGAGGEGGAETWSTPQPHHRHRARPSLTTDKRMGNSNLFALCSQRILWNNFIRAKGKGRPGGAAQKGRPVPPRVSRSLVGLGMVWGCQSPPLFFGGLASHRGNSCPKPSRRDPVRPLSACCAYVLYPEWVHSGESRAWDWSWANWEQAFLVCCLSASNVLYTPREDVPRTNMARPPVLGDWCVPRCGERAAQNCLSCRIVPLSLAPSRPLAIYVARAVRVVCSKAFVAPAVAPAIIGDRTMCQWFGLTKSTATELRLS